MTDPTAEHTYAADGMYDITVTVTDNRGATNADTTQVNVVQLPNVDPTADFTVDCWGLDCDFDAAASEDSDGTIVDYAWDFGDLNLGSGEQVNNVYAGSGEFDVTLTVTDNRGGTATDTQHITVNEIATSIDFRDAVSVDGGNGNNVSIQVPATVQQDDLLVLFVTNGNSRTANTPSGWTQLGTRSDSELTTQVFWRFAAAGSAGTNVSTALSGNAPVIASMVAYSGVNASPVSASASAAEPSTTAVTAHTTPGVTVPADGAWVLSYWADRNSALSPNVPTTSWTPPAEQVFRADEFSSNSNSRVSSLLTDDGAPVLAGVRGGLTATADAGAEKGTMWTIVLASQ